MTKALTDWVKKKNKTKLLTWQYEAGRPALLTAALNLTSYGRKSKGDEEELSILGSHHFVQLARGKKSDALTCPRGWLGMCDVPLARYRKESWSRREVRIHQRSFLVVFLLCCSPADCKLELQGSLLLFWSHDAYFQVSFKVKERQLNGLSY